MAPLPSQVAPHLPEGPTAARCKARWRVAGHDVLIGIQAPIQRKPFAVYH
jgi:hypothetical protein